MRIIISPAKQMRVNTDSLAPASTPAFLEDAQLLAKWIGSLSFAEQKRLWACSDKLATQASEMFEHMDLTRELTPALIAYQGIQYQTMAPSVFEENELAYVQEHLRILSGFYGVLRPLDGVVPYRLEMQAKAQVAGHANLYEYWGERLAEEVMDDSQVLIDLASKEYSKAVLRHLGPQHRCVSVVFGELEGDRVVQKGVYVKMARGEMVRYLASIGAEEPERMRDFSWSGYAFDEARSTETSYTFVRG